MNPFLGKTYHSSVKTSNYSKILYGDKDTAILLLHGFIGSPFEVVSLGEQLNAAGFTVFMPLLAGFGGSSALVNQATYLDWQATLRESIEKLEALYPKIIIGGFSLGGAIVSDFLTDANVSLQNIIGAILLAPYYKPRIWGAKSGSHLADFFVDTISLTNLYKISGNEDLKIPLENPEYYNTELPIKAAKEIVLLGEKIRHKEKLHKINIPTLLVYSEDDRTVDNREAIKFTRENFQILKEISFPKNKKIRHQLAVPSGNNEFNALCTALVTFVREISLE